MERIESLSISSATLDENGLTGAPDSLTRLTLRPDYMTWQYAKVELLEKCPLGRITQVTFDSLGDRYWRLAAAHIERLGRARKIRLVREGEEHEKRVVALDSATGVGRIA